MESDGKVKLPDQICFTLAVSVMLLTEYIILRHPVVFPLFYSFILTGLVIKRYPEFRAQNADLFMLDFCYFMNISTIIQINFFPDHLLWFKANYVLCIGCLMNAMVVWQNTLVFHTMEKLTSLSLHFFAPFTLHLLRWGIIPCDGIPLEDQLSLSELFLVPLFLYLVWQMIYLAITEVFMKDTLRKDPERTSSLRYLATDTNNGMHQLVTSLMRRLGVMGDREVFQADTVKTKLIFLTAQLVYTLTTLAPVPLLYVSYELSCLYIATIFLWTVWRGGATTLQDFGERYGVKFVKGEEKKEN